MNKVLIVAVFVVILVVAIWFYTMTPPVGAAPLTGTSPAIPNLPNWNSGVTTWSDASQKCQAAGKKLCSSKDVCPNGVGGAVAGSSGVDPATDQWSPVSDKTNEWIQIGNQSHPRCTLHGPKFGEPVWGNNPAPASFKNKFACC